jgi:hypothetical protein
LRELKTHGPELLLRLVSQDVASRGPERGNRLPNGSVTGLCVGIYVAGICNFAFGSAVNPMNLAMSKEFEIIQAKFLCECVYTGVPEQLVARVIDARDGWVRLKTIT